MEPGKNKNIKEQKKIKRNVRKMKVYFSGMRFKKLFLILVIPSFGFEMNHASSRTI